MLTSKEIINLQRRLVYDYNYKAFNEEKSHQYRKIWFDNLPKELDVIGSDICIFTKSGDLVCTGYTRIVIGDYGAFIEYLPEQANKSIYKVKEGQEYRVNNPRYMNNVKYNWFTIDGTDIKIYEQKKEVSYADYKIGRFYINAHENLIFKKK